MPYTDTVQGLGLRLQGLGFIGLYRGQLAEACRLASRVQ